MAIQINGTTVIDNSRQINNVVGYYGPGVATQAEATAGTNNDQLMTPLRVKQAIDAGGGSVINRIQRGSSTFSSSATNAPITSVDTGKAFISSSSRGNIFGSTNQSGIGGGSSKLTSATNIQFQGGSGVTVPSGWSAPPSQVPQTGYVCWEVIEFT